MIKMTPLRIVTIYFFISALWILSSDVIVSTITSSKEMFARLSIIKGWLFVLTTSLLLYGLMRRYVSERDRAEAALQKSEQRFHSLVDDAPIGIVIVRDTRFIYANRKFVELHGYGSAGEIIGRLFYDLTAPGEREELVARALKRERGMPVETTYESTALRRDGTEFPATATSIRIDFDDGPAMLAFVKDISARKQAEEALRKNVKRVRDITSSLGEGVYVLDAQGQVTFMNPEAERLLGWTAAEFNNQNNFHNVVLSQRLDGVLSLLAECELRKVITTGERYLSHEEQYIRKNGTNFAASVITTPLVEEGTIVGSVTAFRDVTDIKRIEQERKKLVAELQQALAEIKTLHGILPICSSCKKIRDDKGSWTQMETYISRHSDAAFSHGYCPECGAKAVEALKDFKERFQREEG